MAGALFTNNSKIRLNNFSENAKDFKISFVFLSENQLKHKIEKRQAGDQEGGGDTKNTDTNSTDFSSPGIDDMNEASKIKCKKNS
jgi:hypothetical protein